MRATPKPKPKPKLEPKPQPNPKSDPKPNPELLSLALIRSREEDEIILQSVDEFGPKWLEIAARLPGRVIGWTCPWLTGRKLGRWLGRTVYESGVSGRMVGKDIVVPEVSQQNAVANGCSEGCCGLSPGGIHADSYSTKSGLVPV